MYFSLLGSGMEKKKRFSSEFQNISTSFLQIMNYNLYMCSLGDLLPFAQFKKCEKNLLKSETCNFTKVTILPVFHDF